MLPRINLLPIRVACCHSKDLKVHDWIATATCVFAYTTYVGSKVQGSRSKWPFVVVMLVSSLLHGQGLGNETGVCFDRAVADTCRGDIYYISNNECVARESGITNRPARCR